jgi:Family of unknown function (DUF5677)
MPNEHPLQRFVDLVQLYRERLKADLKTRLQDFPVSPEEEMEFAVVGGLMARMVTLVTELGFLPGALSGDIAPLFLRPMSDIYINLVWILKAPQERSKKFVEHGLGQTKLMIEQRRERLVRDGENPDDDEVIAAMETFLSAQKFAYLVDVDLGSWSGKNVRQMAEEAGELDFYNMFYVPNSQVVHSTWHHLANFNLRQTENPLHGFRLVPVVSESVQHLDIMLSAVHLTQMAFASLDAHYFPGRRFENRETWFAAELGDVAAAMRREKTDEA